MNVDDLYKSKFDNYQMNSSGSNWNDVNKRLKKKNFQHFNPLRFNIYYLILFFSIGAFASYSTVKNFVLRNEIKTLQKSVIHYQRTVDSLEVQTITTPIIINDTNGLSFKPIIVPTNTPPNSKTPLLQSIKVSNDTAILPKPDSTPHIQHVSIKKIRKTIYVRQQVMVSKDTGKLLQ